MKIYYEAAGEITGVERHEKILAHLDTYPLEVLHSDTAVEEADAMIAELTVSSEESLQKVLLAHKLGKRTLLLADRLKAPMLPESLVGISSLRPDTGLRYSKLSIAISGVKVFLGAHFNLRPRGESDLLGLSVVQHARLAHITLSPDQIHELEQLEQADAAEANGEQLELS